MTHHRESLRLFVGAAHRGALQERSPAPDDQQDQPILCDLCGDPCDAIDAVVNSAGTISLCGSFRGNGCDRYLVRIEAGEDIDDILGTDDDGKCINCGRKGSHRCCPICGSHRCSGYCV